MSSASLRIDPTVRDRLIRLAAERGIEPGDLVAELVLAAETAELVAEVNEELERLSQGPVRRRRRDAEVRELEATVSAWMAD